MHGAAVQTPAVGDQASLLDFLQQSMQGLESGNRDIVEGKETAAPLGRSQLPPNLLNSRSQLLAKDSAKGSLLPRATAASPKHKDVRLEKSFKPSPDCSEHGMNCSLQPSPWLIGKFSPMSMFPGWSPASQLQIPFYARYRQQPSQ